jgi:uncharacterized protein YigE (DUF2233 family)
MHLALGALLLAMASGNSWQTIAPGAERLRLEEDGLRVDLFRFDLARYRPEVVVMGPERPRAASALRAETGAVAVVNGGFFDEQWRSLGLRIAAGKTVIGLRPRVDWGVLLVRAGRAHIVHSKEFHADPAIEQAIQVGPRLLAGGQPLKLKPQAARRTAVALDREGRTLTLVIADAPADAQRLAEALARLGFDAALMFDGGPSTQLALELGDVRLSWPGGYAVPDAFVVRRR